MFIDEHISPTATQKITTLINFNTAVPRYESSKMGLQSPTRHHWSTQRQKYINIHSNQMHKIKQAVSRTVTLTKICVLTHQISLF